MMDANAEMIRRWTDSGDKAMEREDYELAVALFRNAFSIGTSDGVKYLIPRISACYRRMNRPTAAIEFYKKAIELFGYSIIDKVIMTTISSAYGDLREWENALRCANQAAFLNGGMIDEYLENVFGRIYSNIPDQTCCLLF